MPAVHGGELTGMTRASFRASSYAGLGVEEPLAAPPDSSTPLSIVVPSQSFSGSAVCLAAASQVATTR